VHGNASTLLAYLAIVAVAWISSRLVVVQLPWEAPAEVHSHLENGIMFGIATGLLILLAKTAERSRRPGHYYAASFTTVAAIFSLLGGFVRAFGVGR
jgi:hypothetical protein